MAAKKARDLSQKERDFMRDVFTKGLTEARRIHGISEEALGEIFAAAGLSDAQGDVLARLPELASQANFDPSQLPPEIQQLRNTVTTENDRANDIINTRGQTNETIRQRGVLDRTSLGQDNEQIAQRETGFRILEQGGRTEESKALFSRAEEVFSSGGRARSGGLETIEANALKGLEGPDKDLARIRNAGEALAKAGGFTPELRDLMGQATTLLNTTGGLTPELRQVFDESIKIVKAGGEGGALLPRDQVIQFARDEAGKAINDNAEAAIRESQARGGGPGAIFGGAQGGRLAEFADKASSLQADTLRKALSDRQALQLDQLKAAFAASGGAAEAGAQRETQLKSLGASLAGQIAGAASSNLQSGLSTALGAQNSEIARQAGLRDTVTNVGDIFARREATAFGAGQNALNLDASRLELGGNLLQNVLNSRAAANTNLTNLTGLEFGRESNAFQSALGLGGLNLGILGFGAENQQNAFNNQLNALNLQANIGQQGQQNVLNAAGLTNDQAGLEAGLANTGLVGSNQAALAAAGHQATPGSFTGSFLSSLGSAAGNAIFSGLPTG